MEIWFEPVRVRETAGHTHQAIGGALGWLGGRCGAGGAIAGGGSSIRMTVHPMARGVIVSADASMAGGTCNATQSGQIGQSAG